MTDVMRWINDSVTGKEGATIINPNSLKIPITNRFLDINVAGSGYAYEFAAINALVVEAKYTDRF